MNCRIKEIKNPEGNGRILAVSDIHGYVHYLDGVLKKVNYTVQDTLVIVGDMIKKGPESLRTVRYVMALCAENSKVYAVMGNVDYHRTSSFYNDSPEGNAGFLRLLKYTKQDWERGLFLDMLDELGIMLEDIREEDVPGIKARIREQFAQELDFLRNLPTVLIIGNYLFVHAGVPTDCLRELETVDAFKCMKIDAFLNTVKAETVFEKTVVVGHWPVYHYREKEDCLTPLFDYEKNVVSIDGGCALKYGCQLNVLIIPKSDADIREVTYEAYDDYPVIVASKSQKARDWTVRLRYFDCEVEILEEKEDVVLLRHVSSGKEFIVPKSYLYFGTGKVCCADSSDARLAIEKGDRLSVIAETSVGHIVKKNGVIGWYEVAKPFRHKTLEERAADFDGKLMLDGEYDGGEPVGREVW